MFAPAAGSAPLFTPNPIFARDVAEGLTRTRKTLPASWLYDEIGSALFEVITLLPEYGLTRADNDLLTSAAGEIVRAANQPRLIVELGSGTGTKTRAILQSAARRGPVLYFPIDISGAALDQCAKTVSSLQGVRTEPIEGTYLDGITRALSRRRVREHAMILFLGSTIGNFNRTQAASFLRQVRGHVQPGDFLLLGADLVKPRDRLLLAYDDPTGVTAAFNLNLLGRINRELGGHFDLARFAHEARWNDRLSRIEMHLQSRVAQKVAIDALDLTIAFARGETIWTESSHKFRVEEIAHLGERAGWSSVRQWLDRDWGFAEMLFQPK
jgi:dimethylhistidine N-methyltransferase